MPTWITGKVINIKHWTDQLFSLIVHAPIDKFTAGQFTRIKIKTNNKVIQRAYSYLNAPNNPNLEFYISTITTGKCTPLLRTLRPNDPIILTKESYGNFTLNKIPDCANLWMLASGTGIGPYLSILEYHEKRLDQFSNIILVHATQFSKNLNYLPKMISLKNLYNKKLHIQTILSQEQCANTLYGRIPNLIENNNLEKKIGLNLHKNNCHIMLCGNPNMIRDVKIILKQKYNMQEHHTHNPGHITQERYW